MTDQRTCRNCGDPIPDGRRFDAEHCSDRCRREAWADRKAESVAEEIADDVRSLVRRRLEDLL